MSELFIFFLNCILYGHISFCCSINRKYEKDRRDRLNLQLTELNSLLPGYNSSEIISKAKIFENAIQYIKELKGAPSGESES